MEEYVILVDINDQPIGTMEKMEAHQRGSLHRAFSVFIFNSKNELLLQQRAMSKYHSPGLWSNTCCSHPKPGEETLDAAQRRLMEEMRMNTPLNYAFNFTYNASFSNGLIEHEYDHVFFGQSDELPDVNLVETAAYKYLSLDTLAQELEQFPDQYTPWLKICFDAVLNFKKNT